MRSVLPEGIGDAALKEFWLQKLPPAILTVISGLDGALALRPSVLTASWTLTPDTKFQPCPRTTRSNSKSKP